MFEAFMILVGSYFGAICGFMAFLFRETNKPTSDAVPYAVLSMSVSGFLTFAFMMLFDKGFFLDWRENIKALAPVFSGAVGAVVVYIVVPILKRRRDSNVVR